jgi:putative ABC transport system permease protein
MTWPANLAEQWPTLFRTLVAVLLLVAVVAAVLRGFRAAHPFAPAAAILRGALQLAAISLILSGIISDPIWVGVGLGVMMVAAIGVVNRRIGASAKHFGLASAAISLGTVVTLAIVFLSGAIQFSPRYVLAVGGIVIGNAMSISTIAGRRFREAVLDHWDEVEGWLALGATPRQSTRELARRSVYFAMIPSTDQTRTTGLVTLPGAFVGAIFGGASPLEAGRFQIVVLAGILSAGALVAVTLISLLAPVERKPQPVT